MTSPLASLKQGVLRPQDAAGIYVQPHAEFRRWEEAGVLLRVAHGYYAHIPESSRGGSWRPEIESLALGIGQADYGPNQVALMHISAARIQGAIPRALAIAVIAIPKRRPPLETTCGRIFFVQRDIENLKRMRIETELASGWCTTIEQTALDLANRPALVPGLEVITKEAACILFLRSDDKKVHGLLQSQRFGTAITRLKKWMLNA